MVYDVVMTGGEGVWGWRRGGFRDPFSIPIQFQVDSFYYTVLLLSSSSFPFRCQSHNPVLLSFILFSMNESRVLFERYRTVFHNIALNNGAYCLNDSASSDVLLLIHLLIDVGIAAINHC